MRRVLRRGTWRPKAALATVALALVAVASCANVIGLESIQELACVGDCGAPDASLEGQAMIQSSSGHGATSHDATAPRRDASSGAHDAALDGATSASGPASGSSSSKGHESSTHEQSSTETGGSGSHSTLSSSSGASSTATGCTTDAECAAASPSTPRCDLNSGQCVVCLPQNDNCPVGTICEFSSEYACVAGCSGTGTADCPTNDAGVQLTCCSGACVDANDDPNNCGGCGTVCSDANDTPSCAAGACTSACNPGFSNCSGNLQMTGCETETGGTDIGNCGGCNVVCADTNDTPSCTGGACTSTCTAGFQHCTGDLQVTGCETETGGTDVENCGGCGVACSGANDTPSCTGGVCTSTCAPGFENCSGNLQMTGCDTETGGTDINNCGGCHVVCSAANDTPSCSGGACNSPCTAGYADCDGNLQADGCETLIDGEDCNNCGGCNVTCPSCFGCYGGSLEYTCSSGD